MSVQTIAVKDLPPPAASLAEIVAGLGPGFAAAAAAHDEDDSFVAENYRALRASGLVEAGVPGALGGGDAGVSELADMLRQIAHHCSSTALAFAMHSHQVAIPAWRWRHQKVAAAEPLLKRVAAERLILLSSGGSDWVAGSGEAQRVEGGYRITARKIFTSAAEAGDVLMTSAVLREEGAAATVLHFGVPMTSPAVRIEPTWRSLGMRGTASNDVTIEGHFVPEQAVALKRQAGVWHPLFQIVAVVALPLIYAAYLGVAQSACAIALELARKRRPDHVVTELVGRMQTELRGAEIAHRAMLAPAAAGRVSADAVNDVAMARSLLVDHVLRATELALEAAGGAGFYRRHGLERRFRDIQGARFHPIQAGQQAIYAGSLALGLPVDTVF